MKRKFLLGVLTLFVAFIFTANVNAQDSVLNIPWSTTAKSPNNVPADGSTLWSTLADSFDYSRVQFSTTGGGTFYGFGSMRKIMLTTMPNPSASANSGASAMGDWFSAYCLDGSLKYPAFGIYSSPGYLVANQANDTEGKFLEIIRAGLFNNTNFAAAIKDNFTKNDMYFDPEINWTVTPEFLALFRQQAGSSLDGLSDEQVTAAAKNAYMNAVVTKAESSEHSLTDTISVLIKSVQYDETTINAADIANDSSASDYLLSFTILDVPYLKYTASTPSNNNYLKALWIIEHSYPTLDLNTALEKAGTSLSNLEDEIAVLQATESHECTVAVQPGETCPSDKLMDTSVSNLSGDELTKYAESYVYSTVQYAIWKVEGGVDPNDNTLGNSITNVTSLNKLYQYLINVPDLTNYGDSDKQFTNTITIKKPEVGKEIKEEKSDYYIYGPYVASYSALTNDPISLTITNSAEDKANISIVDNSGTVINAVPNGGAFYVKVMKKAKIASVMVDAKVENVTTFLPSSNRARVYTSIYPMAQNVMSGGKVGAKTLTTSETFNYNAKTGVENVAMLLMVTLVAFSLGYMVLSFKAKPIGLN